MGDQVRIRLRLDESQDEVNRRVGEALRAAGREPPTRDPVKPLGSVDQLLRERSKGDDPSKGWVERSAVTPAESRQGVTDSVVIHYPPANGAAEGKQLRIGLDASGQTIKIDPIGEAGKVVDSYVRKDGVWNWKDKQGALHRMPFQTYELSLQTGEFQTQDTADHIKVLKLDGSKSDVRILPTGAKVRTDATGKIEQVERTDSSILIPKYKPGLGNELDGFSVLKPDSKGELVTLASYHREGNDFVPDEKFKDKPKLTDLALANNGNLTYKHKDGPSAGKEYTEWSTGATVPPDGKSTYKFDDLGRITAVIPCAEDIAKGAVIRDNIKYKGGTNQIVSIDSQQPSGKDSRKYHNEFDEATGKWTRTDSDGRAHAVRQVYPYFNNRGEFAFADSVGTGTQARAVEHVLQADGGQRLESRTRLADGSLATAHFNASGKLTGTDVERDGQPILRLREDVVDGETRISRTDADGKTVVWRKSPGRDAIWSTNEPLAPSLRAMTFNERGEIKYLDEKKATHTRLADNSEHVRHNDGTFSDLDRYGRIVRAGKDDKHYLQYDYDEAGKLAKVNRVFPAHNGEIWNVTSGRKGEVLEDGRFQYTGDDGRPVVVLRDLRSNIYEKEPSRDRVTLLMAETVLPTGEKTTFEYGDDRDSQHPKRITFRQREKRRGQDAEVITVLEALPTNPDDPNAVNNPGQRVAPMQLYRMTSTRRFEQPPFPPFEAERRLNGPSTYCALAVRDNGDLEATSYDRRAERFVFHTDRLDRLDYATKVKSDEQRFLMAKAEFDRVFDREVAPRVNRALVREEGEDLLNEQRRTNAKRRAARNLYLSHVTGTPRPVFADLSESPRSDLLPRSYAVKAKELEAAMAIIQHQLRTRHDGDI